MYIISIGGASRKTFGPTKLGLVREGFQGGLTKACARLVCEKCELCGMGWNKFSLLSLVKKMAQKM
jgi:hypothetical protein